MPRKQPRTSTIEPPQLPTPLPTESSAPPTLDDREGYNRQLWAGVRLNAQQAEDVALEHMLLRNVSLQGAELPLLQASDCRFDTCDLANCGLEKAYLRRIEWLGCRMVGLKLIDADLSDVVFSRCNGQLARIWNGKLQAVRFEHCAFQEASFDGSDLSGVVFHKCDLTGADFRNTKLAGTDFRGSTLSGLLVEGRDLAGAIIDPLQALDVVQRFGVVVRQEE